MTMDDKNVEPREGVSDATPAPPAATGQAEKALGEAGEAVQQAARQACRPEWSRGEEAIARSASPLISNTMCFPASSAKPQPEPHCSHHDAADNGMGDC